MCITELEFDFLVNFKYITASDRENKMKLFKLIVHQKDFSGWCPNVHIILISFVMFIGYCLLFIL